MKLLLHIPHLRNKWRHQYIALSNCWRCAFSYNDYRFVSVHLCVRVHVCVCLFVSVRDYDECVYVWIWLRVWGLCAQIVVFVPIAVVGFILSIVALVVRTNLCIGHRQGELSTINGHFAAFSGCKASICPSASWRHWRISNKHPDRQSTTSSSSSVLASVTTAAAAVALAPGKMVTGRGHTRTNSGSSISSSSRTGDRGSSRWRYRSSCLVAVCHLSTSGYSYGCAHYCACCGVLRKQADRRWR